MNRRYFLGSVAAGTALAAMPTWLQKAFAAEPSSASLVFDAYRRARRKRMPLVVFVIPEDSRARYLRGHALGAFLNHGADEHLAALAFCEVVCATAAHLRLLVPHAPEGEPFAVLIAPNGVPARIETIDVELESYQEVRRTPGLTWQKMQQRGDDIVEENIARIGRALRSAIDGPPSADMAKLAAITRAKLTDGTVPGARWARTAGCGTDFEDDDHGSMVDCGMAFVPEKSQRFLYLLAKAQP